ncbi:DNA repair and recombination protein RAD54B [Drechslerella dactyloides]|uniref:DNA repair and recombination protein RAD54B n=1 Tax=Drechslerella dactyloides TaxID=74499 RepID=A0AAD6J5C1_DREDA|nr:DNA repair and recombination protein RAD54B [Drechslerella dactyloides]
MYRKKFIPPLLKKPSTQPAGPHDSEPPQKKIKLEPQTGSQSSVGSNSSTQSNGIRKLLPTPRSNIGPGSKFNPPQLLRRPLVPVNHPPGANDKREEETTGSDGSGRHYFNVLWRKFQARKHKTWDGDGVLAIVNGNATLQDVNGRDIGSGRVSKIPSEGDLISLGGKEIEIDSLLEKSDFLAGKPFLKSKGNLVDTSATVRPAEFYARGSFKSPLLAGTTAPKTHPQKATARFDPTAEGALVMRRPTVTVESSLKNKTIVDVVVDPVLSRHLRPHQREGVAFLYEAVMGMRPYEGRGAILADEMGLGKTLQTIALLWTLLKQNPAHGQAPLVKKAMIVCPVTLINNWKREFKKWLGNERIHVFVADAKSNVRDFTHGPIYNVMIVGYERLRNIQDKLKQCQVDIIIADEGHRLKSAENKSAQAIRALATPRRIILSGTPLQNDLREFFVMVDFVNPGILENYSTFKKQFENPIVRSQQPEASKADKELGNARKAELTRLTNLFVLRRTAKILSKYLPPKTDIVVFCRPTKHQLELYKAILNTSLVKRQMGSMETALQLITLLKKVCNSTALLKSLGKDDEDGKLSSSILEEVRVAGSALIANNSSGKLKVLEKLLVTLKETTQEKVVLVSNYTSTLDILEKMLNSKGFHHLRLDGKTPTNKRQDLVDKFNRVSPDVAFAFLLSSKSGGAGINLIGASRLILFDSDWNPANDLQAMARVHRDGQKSHVYIYRMMTTGCIDEKIYQRQITKQGLADSVMDQKAGGSNFTTAELRDLFTLDTETVCNTHDLLGCNCGEMGDLPGECIEDEEEEEEEPIKMTGWTKASIVDMDQQEDAYRKATSKARQRMKALLEFSHISPEKISKKVAEPHDLGSDSAEQEEDEEPMVVIEDEILRQVVDENPKSVSFIFSKNSM